MNNEVHIVPVGLHDWAVNVGKISYQGFDSEQKAVEFGQKMAARSKEQCKIIFHDREGGTFPIDEQGQIQRDIRGH